MLKKTICMLSVLSFVGACSHHQSMMKKSPHHYKIGKSFLDTIKTKKPFSPQNDKRFPASGAKSVPGLQQFMAALKANPEFLKVPVGMKVTKESNYENNEGRSNETIIYLAQKPGGYFVLENSLHRSPKLQDYLKDLHFRLYEDQNFETIQNELSTMVDIKQFKKLSATKFLMIFEVPKVPEFNGVSCYIEIELTKSSELAGSICKDSNGNIISESKVVAIKEINLSDYADSLKSVKLEVFPRALECNFDADENCSDSVIDANEKDWSHILK